MFYHFDQSEILKIPEITNYKCVVIYNGKLGVNMRLFRFTKIQLGGSEPMAGQLNIQRQSRYKLKISTLELKVTFLEQQKYR